MLMTTPTETNIFFTTKGTMDPCLPARQPHIVDVVVAQYQSLRLRDRKRIPESVAWVVHDLPWSWRTRRRERNDNDPDANVLGHCYFNVFTQAQSRPLTQRLGLKNIRDNGSDGQPLFLCFYTNRVQGPGSRVKNPGSRVMHTEKQTPRR